MLIKTIKLLFKNNASETEKDFQGLNDTLDDTADANEKVNKSFDVGKTFAEVYGDEARTLGDKLGQTTDRLYELATAGDTASDEYRALVEEAGRLRQAQVETDLAIEGASQTFSQKLGPAIQGVTSGFSVAQGAMALFGSENKELEESLLKVQSALAIQQGIQGLTESYKQLSLGSKLASVAQGTFAFVTGGATTGLKLFRLALISTGIGALVVGIGLLVANFDKLLGVFKPVIDGFKAVGDFIGITNFAEEEREEASQKRYAAEKKRLEERKKQLEKQAQAQRDYTDAYLGELEIRRRMAQKNGDDIKAIDEEILETQIQSVEQEKKNFIEGRNIRLKELEALERRLLERYGANSAKYRDQVKINQKLAQKIRNEEFNEITVFNNQIQSLRLDNEDKEAESLERRRQKYREYRDLRLQIARQIEDLENELLEEGIEKELEINRDKFRRLREDAERNTELTSTERKKLLALFTEQEEAAVAEIRKKYYEEEKSEKLELLNFLDEANKAEVEKEKAKNLAILDNAVETNKKIIESDKAVAQAKKDIQDAQIANVEAGIALFKDLAGENNKLQALAIAAENAVGIAKIIISTQAANAAAKLKYAAIPGGLALAAAEITANKISAGIGIAASIAAAAKGIASLKQSAPLDSGGDLGGGGVGSEPIAPEFNVVGDAGINQLAQLQQTPTQAFVVSGEVTSAQALDRNRVTNATL